MRRVSILLLCIAFTLSLCSCKKKVTEVQEPAEFFYCHESAYKTDEGVIGSEIREAVRFNGNLELLMQAYLLGPLSDDLESPLPYAVKLVSFDQLGDSVYLTLSREFSTLSGIRLTTACSCIVMTLNAFADVKQVCFRVASGQLDNKDELIMTISDIVLMDNTFEKG